MVRERSKGTVKRVLKKEKKGVVGYHITTEEKQAALKENIDILRSLEKEEFSLIASLNRPGVNRDAVNKRLVKLNKEIESLKKTITEAPSLRSKTFQQVLEPQIKSLFVTRPGEAGYREIKKNMKEIRDFLRNAEEIMPRLGPERRADLSQMMAKYEQELRKLEKYEKAYLERKKRKA